MADLFNLGGDVALVTGSTRGIGKAMTMALAEAGADLLLMRSKPDPAMIKTIHALGRSVDIYECDLEKQDQVGTVVAEILKMHRVTIFVNACGIQRRAAAIEQTDEIFREIMQVNLNAPFAITREVGRAWIAQGIAGRIVLVSSLAAFQGGVRMTSYAASKGGVAMLTKALSNEWAATGIRVNAIAPGYIETDMNLDTRTNPDQTHADSISQRIPAGRWGVPEDLKAVTIFLASRSATTYITGETIAVDGGWLAR